MTSDTGRRPTGKRDLPFLASGHSEPAFLWAALGLSLIVNLGAALAFARRPPQAVSDAERGTVTPQGGAAVEASQRDVLQRVASLESAHRQIQQHVEAAESGLRSIQQRVAAAEQHVEAAESGLRSIQQRVAAIEQQATTPGRTGLRRVVLALGESGQSACLAAGGTCVAMESMSAHNSSGREGREVYTCSARLRRAHGGECSNGEVFVIPSIFYPARAQGGFDTPLNDVDMCLRENAQVIAFCAVLPDNSN